jgi:hypothetical protein
MIGIASMVKWGAALAVLTILAAGVKKGYEYHLDQIDQAVIAAELKSAIAEQRAVREREEFLKEESRKEKEIIEAQLRVERSKVTDLQRQLLIDHDLDRLLQRKPGLILNIANKGTEEVLKELEEITQ